MSDTKYSPYVAARHEWDERYGGVIARARQWRLTAVITSCIALVATGGLVAMASRIGHVPPFVMVLDSSLHPLASGLAEGTAVDNGRLRRQSLELWMNGLREVTTDGTAQRKAIDAVYSQISKGSAAQSFISDYYRQAQPFKRAQEETVSVDVNTVLATTEHTYEVDWTETTRDLYGTVKSTERWKGSLEIAINPPTDEQYARVNPLGVYVTNINWSKVL